MVCYPLMYNHKLPWIDEINLFRWFCPVQVSCCWYLVPYFMIDWMNESFVLISPQENFMFLNFCKFFLYIQFSWKKGFVFIFQLKQNIHIEIENLKLKQSCNRKCKLIIQYFADDVILMSQQNVQWYFLEIFISVLSPRPI